MVDGMNHVLKTAPATRAENVAAYSDPTLPVVPKVIDEVVQFVKGVKKKG
jgi:hypothetical protein